MIVSAVFFLGVVGYTSKRVFFPSPNTEHWKTKEYTLMWQG
jgi:hypothetical protein